MATSRLSKIHLYFKNIYLDYFEVFKEARQGARQRPIRASLYGLSSLFVLNLFRANEGLSSYKSEVISACNRVGSVTGKCRNPLSEQYIQQIGELNSHQLLRQVDLGFSTLIYKEETNPENALFRHNCPQLKPSLKEFLSERVIDLGFLGHWIQLELKMRNYDVNEHEWDHSPDQTESRVTA